MSDETADAKGLFNNEVRIKGTVIGLEKLKSKQNKDWAKLTLKRIRKFGEEEIPEHYEISIFGKAMEGQASNIKEHDEIEVVCRVQADEWKERWFIKLSLKSVAFIQIGNRDKSSSGKTATTESGTREVPAPPVDEDANLPF